ncbi:MAG: DNA-binding protein WhiA [Spiroplasma sp.]|nr:DNA-binding protein WhiA [Spiroplasma sp.]
MSSFTMMIKDEICQKSFEDCCQKSLLSAFVRLNKLTNNNKENQEIKLYSFHEPTINLIFQLLKNQGWENYSEILTKKYKKANRYLIEVNNLSNGIWLKSKDFDITNKNVKKHCLRAYIAGIFLVSGSINSPTTSNYHLELQFNDYQFVKTIQKLLLDNFNLDFKIIIRRNKFILYLKKSNDISEFLKLLDCPQAVFSFEDQRIKRELLNTINRFNNIDISNQQKTLVASLEQVKMITKIKELNGFNQLSDKCQILADLRLINQDASLTELSIFYYEKTGEMITKSGVNHLMRELKKTYRELLSM